MIAVLFGLRSEYAALCDGEEVNEDDEDREPVSLGKLRQMVVEPEKVEVCPLPDSASLLNYGVSGAAESPAACNASA